MSKYYGLTNKPNQGVQDKAPDWMNDFFKKQAESPTEKKEKNKNPFYGVNDRILNPKLEGVKRDQN